MNCCPSTLPPLCCATSWPQLTLYLSAWHHTMHAHGPCQCSSTPTQMLMLLKCKMLPCSPHCSAPWHLPCCQLTLYLSAWRHTVSLCGSTPDTASNTHTAPSSTRSARSTSKVKSTWPAGQTSNLSAHSFEALLLAHISSAQLASAVVLIVHVLQ